MDDFGKFLDCPDCGRIAIKVRRWSINHGKNIGPNEWVYKCPVCDIYVGCHPGTDLPLGTMADRALRLSRRKAHKAFDWAWKVGDMTRGQAYQKLAEVLEIPPEDFDQKAHIAMLDQEQCRKVIKAFNALRPWKMPHH